MKNLIGKNAVLTGASRGIGVHIANHLTKNGINVLGIARNESGLKNTQSIVKNNKGKFTFRVFDLADTLKLKDLVKDIDDVDFLINNAGIELYKQFENYRLNEIEKIINVNLLGPIELTRQLIPKIKKSKGHIINISSLAGKKGVIYNGIYSATKSGLILWSDALDQELKKDDVGVSVICPGYIAETGMFNDGGYRPPILLGESNPRKVAFAVIDAIIKNKKEIIINSGPTRLLIAVGQLFPRLGDLIVNWLGVPNLSKKRTFNSKILKKL